MEILDFMVSELIATIVLTHSCNRRAVLGVRRWMSDVGTHDHDGSLEAARPKKGCFQKMQNIQCYESIPALVVDAVVDAIGLGIDLQQNVQNRCRVQLVCRLHLDALSQEVAVELQNLLDAR
jgi:hypothetical protein